MKKIYLPLACLSFLSLSKTLAQTSTVHQNAITDTAKKSPAAGGKVFGGIAQYNTWSLGFNLGIMSPSLVTGGSNDDFNGKPILDAGYGISLKKQLSHSFAAQLDVHGGSLEGQNDFTNVTQASRNYATSFKTNIYNISLSALVNVISVDWLHRTNNVHFYASAGYAYNWYQPVVTYAAGHTGNYTQAVKDNAQYGGVGGKAGTHTFVKEVSIPVGVGVKFKLADAMALNLGYTENFTDGDNLDGTSRVIYHKDRYSYAYAGLEFSLGAKAKPVLEWANPVACIYQELYDAELRLEVEALKKRAANVETTVKYLLVDSDGDGVADQFDKCPNTPAGTVVDGSGCEVHFVEAAPMGATPTGSGYGGGGFSKTQKYIIVFGPNDATLTADIIKQLNEVAAILNSNPGTAINLNGHSSSDEIPASLNTATTDPYLTLSKKRVDASYQYLIQKGVNKARLNRKPEGKDDPVVPESNITGNWKNRSIEVESINP